MFTRIQLWTAFIIIFAGPSLAFAQDRPKAKDTRIPIGENALYKVNHRNNRASFHSRHPKQVLLDLVYTPHRKTKSAFGKSWSMANRLQLKKTKHRVIVQSSSGEELFSFKNPLSQGGRKYQSPRYNRQPITSRLPVPARLEPRSSGFTLKMGDYGEYTFDREGFQKARKTATGKVIRYRYSPAGMLEKITSSQGGDITLHYDYKRMLVKKITTPQGSSYYDYTKSGYLRDVVHPRGRRERFSYRRDKNGEMVLHKYVGKSGNSSYVSNQTGGVEGVFTYRGSRNSGHLASVKTNDGRERYFRYLKNGLEVTGKRGKLLYKVKKQFDGNGRLTKITTADKKGKLEYHFNRYGQVERVRQTPQNRHKGTSRLDVRFTYDNRGRLVRAFNRDGRRIHFSYDRFGRITGLKKTGGTVMKFGYKKGGRWSAVSADGYVLSYYYNKQGRLIQAISGNTVHRFFYNDHDKNQKLYKVLSTSKEGFRRKLTTGRRMNSKDAVLWFALDGGQEHRFFFRNSHLRQVTGPREKWRYNKNRHTGLPESRKAVGKSYSFRNKEDRDMIRLGGSRFSKILRDVRGERRAMVSSNQNFVLFLPRPGGKLKPVKSYASQLHDYLKNRVDTATNFYSSKMGDQGWIPFVAGHALNDQIDNLRFGKDYYRAWQAMNDGDYVGALSHSTVDTLRFMSMVGMGKAAKVGLTNRIYKKRWIDPNDIFPPGKKSGANSDAVKKGMTSALVKVPAGRTAKLLTEKFGKNFTKNEVKRRSEKYRSNPKKPKENQGFVPQLGRMESSPTGRRKREKPKRFGPQGRRAYLTLADRSHRITNHLQRELEHKGYQVKRKSLFVGDPRRWGSRHFYLVVSKGSRRYILDPGLADAVRAVYGKSPVAGKKNPMWIMPEDSGLDRPYYQRDQGVFTPQEHKALRDKLAAWKKGSRR